MIVVPATALPHRFSSFREFPILSLDDSGSVGHPNLTLWVKWLNGQSSVIAKHWNGILSRKESGREVHKTGLPPHPHTHAKERTDGAKCGYWHEQSSMGPVATQRKINTIKWTQNSQWPYQPNPIDQQYGKILQTVTHTNNGMNVHVLATKYKHRMLTLYLQLHVQWLQGPNKTAIFVNTLLGISTLVLVSKNAVRKNMDAP